MNEQRRKWYREYMREKRKDEKQREYDRKMRAADYQRNKERNKAEFRARYQKKKEEHRKKNKEHYLKHGAEWKERRRLIADFFSYNKCSPDFVEGCFRSLGACLTVDRTITFSQCCSLIEVFGYDLDDVGYPPFINRREFFRTHEYVKKTTRAKNQKSPE